MGSAVSYYESLEEIPILFDESEEQQAKNELIITIPKLSFQSELSPKKPQFESLPPPPKETKLPSLIKKGYLEPIQNPFPAKASLVNIQREETPRQPIRKYKFSSPRSTMKENTDKFPSNRKIKQKIQLPPINLDEIPSFIIEEPKPVISLSIPSINVNNETQDSDSDSSSDDEYHSCDFHSPSPNNSCTTTAPLDINTLKRKKLDEYVYMKQCNAMEEMFRLQQYQFPITNKLLSH